MITLWARFDIQTKSIEEAAGMVREVTRHIQGKYVSATGDVLTEDDIRELVREGKPLVDESHCGA